MAAPTPIFKGKDITLSTSEVEYELSVISDRSSPLVTLTFELISGTCQSTVAPKTAAPILDVTYGTNSNAGDKWIMDMNPGTSTLRMRCAAAGVVRVRW